MTSLLGKVTGRINTHSFSFTAEDKVKKFQYVKLYHEENGFVLCQVTELTNEENTIRCDCEIIGYRDSRDLLRVPNTTINSGSEVYNADSEFIKKVLGLDTSKGLYMGLLEDYNMIRVHLDAKILATKHLAVLAKTGAGKSYTVGVIIEELIESGVPCLIIDPHGEYSSLKQENTNKKELELMHRYDVKPKNYKDRIIEYSPNTNINVSAKQFSVGITSLSAQEIATLTPMKLGGTQLGILYNAISDVKNNNSDYDLNDIRANLDLVNSNAKYGLYACLDFLEKVGVFTSNPVDVKELVNPGNTTLLNLKGVSPEIQQIIVAKVCNDLFEKRKKGVIPPLFLVVEEAHNFCPERSFGESPSSYILRNIASEGRKFGLGLGVISQRPARVDKNVLSQCNTQIIQKVTNPNDLKAISNSAENISASIVDDIATLPIGTALVVGASAKPILVDVRVRRTEHGGKSVSFESNNQQLNIQKAEQKTEETVKDEGISVNVVAVPGVKGVIPCFLAKVREDNHEFNLLISDSGNILTMQEGKITPAVFESKVNAEGIGVKAKTILDLINAKSETNITYLFNSLNYSFQDVDFILKDLSSKGLITINGANIRVNNKIPFSSYSWISNYKKEVTRECLPEFKNSVNSVKNYLESKGLSVNSIVNVYVK